MFSTEKKERGKGEEGRKGGQTFYNKSQVTKEEESRLLLALSQVLKMELRSFDDFLLLLRFYCRMFTAQKKKVG